MDPHPLSLTDRDKHNTPANPLAPSDYPLHLELERRDALSFPHFALIAVASLLIHIIVFTLAVEFPNFAERHEREPVIVQHRTPLYFPRELTQKAANKGKLSKNIDLASLLASQQEQKNQQGASRPSVRHFEPPKNSGSPETRKMPPRILPDAPVIALNQSPGDPGSRTINGLPAAPPPPQSGPSALPRTGAEAPPKVSHAQQLPPPPGVVPPAPNDDNQNNSQPAIPGFNAQPGSQHAAIELQSDPQGADFKPYLTQILAIVRANWQRVTPDAARTGRLHGRSVIDFIINRDGSIARVIVAEQSGLNQLDMAASTSLVMSSPLPPLPSEFKGFQVRLAFTFAYNMPVK